jgi:hypothetical protein
VSGWCGRRAATIHDNQHHAAPTLCTNALEASGVWFAEEDGDQTFGKGEVVLELDRWESWVWMGGSSGNDRREILDRVR